MEADWEMEVGGDAAIIDAAWPGWIDLRKQPQSAAALPEAAEFPALADALIHLNADSSPVTTIKCDVWPVDTSGPSAFNADELDAPADAARVAIACYIDVLPRAGVAWSTLDDAAEACLNLCSALRARPLRQCRADLVVRRAIAANANFNLGITAYLTACAANEQDARVVLSSAVSAFAQTVNPNDTPARAASKLQ